MPKIFGKEIPPIVLVGATVVAVWLVAGAMQTPENKPYVKTQGPAKKKDMTVVDFTPSDYKAQFASLSTTPSDVFRPLVGKTTEVDAKNQSIDNFSYSGMATLNGKAQGLLENSQTSEGDFVEAGQHWHQSWLVVSLSADSISLRNLDSGEDTVLKAGANEKAMPSAGANSRMAQQQGGNIPFNPAMIGQIGGDMTIQQDAGNGPTINMGNGGNGRRRGGRGGGGRGGGRGGGGGQQGG